MTVTLERPDPVADADSAPEPGPESRPTERVAPLHAGFTAVAALLSTAATAVLVSGLLRGGALPLLHALTGTVLGVGVVFLSLRTTRAARLQWLLLPTSAIAGALAIAPVATGGTANLPGLVAEAVHSGGLLQAPVPFDPGWRFVLVVLLALAGGVALSAASFSGRARLAVVVPLPLTAGAALLQPVGAGTATSVVAVVLVIAALAVAAGAEIAADGVSRDFERRRLLRGAGVLAALAVALVALARADVLFPASSTDRVVPPRKPPVSPPEEDRELFRVSGPSPGPWRVGVLDTYRDGSWLLPAEGVERPDAAPERAASGPTVRFHISDMRGRTLPLPALVRVVDGPEGTQFDPLLELARLPQRLPRGLDYTVRTDPLPRGAELAAAPPVDAAMVAEYVDPTHLPPMPDTVARLVATAPASAFDRLQYLRDRLYEHVVAAGPGTPAPVTARRVAELLTGRPEATPFEITAAEALLARWAGLPARIAFGYFGGDVAGGVHSVRPRHGSAWLEVHFSGFGWIPLVGTPPQAKASDSADLKNEDPRVRPSDEQALSVIIPIRRHPKIELFQIVRYWLAAVTPWLLLAVLLVCCLPVLMKRFRTLRRRRWAAQRGPAAVALVSYAELRDRCRDLNLGGAGLTPLEFLGRLQPDAEHEELAWLVTRLVWGDLRRDPRDADGDFARDAAQSLRKRLDAEQPLLARLLASMSRTSLREPWTEAIPGTANRLRRVRGWFVAAWHVRPHRPAALGVSR